MGTSTGSGLGAPLDALAAGVTTSTSTTMEADGDAGSRRPAPQSGSTATGAEIDAGGVTDRGWYEATAAAAAIARCRGCRIGTPWCSWLSAGTGTMVETGRGRPGPGQSAGWKGTKCLEPLERVASTGDRRGTFRPLAGVPPSCDTARAFAGGVHKDRGSMWAHAELLVLACAPGVEEPAAVLESTPALSWHVGSMMQPSSGPLLVAASSS
mmetsp:Transcript_72810/g.205936  ORF Transcript_72810/g.205936 Transcript_72810/m.205936 type:complete len:211 (+) Transcript_72810:133-765(+)